MAAGYLPAFMWDENVVVYPDPHTKRLGWEWNSIQHWISPAWLSYVEAMCCLHCMRTKQATTASALRAASRIDLTVGTKATSPPKVTKSQIFLFVKTA